MHVHISQVLVKETKRGKLSSNSHYKQDNLPGFWIKPLAGRDTKSKKEEIEGYSLWSRWEFDHRPHAHTQTPRLRSWISSRGSRWCPSKHEQTQFIQTHAGQYESAHTQT